MRILETNSHNENVAPDFSERFSDIVNRQLTAGNINTYFDDALFDLITLIQDLDATQDPTQDSLCGATVEDNLFGQVFGCTVGDVLDVIQRRGGYVRQARNLLVSTDHIEQIILPPGDQSVEIIKGEGEFEQARLEDRTVVVLFTLLVNGLDMDDIQITIGQVDENMFRKTSYVSIEVLSINRSILVCDEVGNATFVFDTERIQESNLDINQLLSMTKDELEGLITGNKGCGVRIISRDRWVDRLSNYLFNDIPTVSDESSDIASSANEVSLEIPRVEMSELSPFRGFYFNQDDQVHYGTVKTIAQKLSTTDGRIRRVINDVNLRAISVRDLCGREQEGYPLEYIADALQAFLMLPQVELGESKFKGYYYHPNTKLHYASIKTIARDLGIAETRIRSEIANLGMEPCLIRDIMNVEREGYPLEPIEETLQPFFALPRVELDDPDYKGFYLDPSTSIRYGALGTIASRLNVGRERVKALVQELKLDSLSLRDLGNNQVEGYPLEPIEEALQPFFALPRVELEESYYKGFYLDPCTSICYGSLGALADKLNVGRKRVKDLVEELGLDPLPLRDLGNNQVEGYPLEPIEEALQPFLALPRVKLDDSDYKGFYLDPITSVHYGTINAIAHKLSMSKERIISLTRELELQALQIRTLLNKDTEGYPLEPIEEALKGE